MCQQSKAIIPLSGNDGLNEEQLATEHAFGIFDARRGIYDNEEPAKDPDPPPLGMSS